MGIGYFEVRLYFQNSVSSKRESEEILLLIFIKYRTFEEEKSTYSFLYPEIHKLASFKN